MGNVVSGTPLRRLAVVAALTTLLALPATASADTGAQPPTIFPAESRGATISVSTTATVTARLIANVHVEFTCEPFEMFDWDTGQTVLSSDARIEFAAVEVLQVSGRTINFGSNDFFATGAAVCDGVTLNKANGAVAAQVVPWKSGTAIAGARVYLVPPDFSVAHYASSGAIQIKLGK